MVGVKTNFSIAAPHGSKVQRIVICDLGDANHIV